MKDTSIHQRRAERYSRGPIRRGYDVRNYQPAQIIDSTIVAPTGPVLERRLAQEQADTADGRGMEK